MSQIDGLVCYMGNQSKASDWRQVVQRLIKAEMSKRGLKYQTLSDELAAIGVEQSADNLRNKINRGDSRSRFTTSIDIDNEYS